MLPPTAPYRNILCDEAWRSPISSELKKDVTASRLETACRQPEAVRQREGNGRLLHPSAPRLNNRSFTFTDRSLTPAPGEANYNNY